MSGGGGTGWWRGSPGGSCPPPARSAAPAPVARSFRIKQDRIPANIYDKGSIRPAIRSTCTRCWFTMTNTIQVRSNFVEPEYLSQTFVRMRSPLQINRPSTFQKKNSGTNVTRTELGYRGTSLKRHRCPLGPYSRTMPRALWGRGVGVFL